MTNEQLQRKWQTEYEALVEASEAIISGAEAMGYPAGEWVAEYMPAVKDSGYDRFYQVKLIINHVYEKIQEAYINRGQNQ